LKYRFILFDRVRRSIEDDRSARSRGIEGLPPYVSYLFQEIDEKNVDIRKNRGYVIERVLENGDDRSVIWCIKTFDKDTISEVIEKSSIITPPTASLWALMLDIGEEKIECLQNRSKQKARSSS
jgi:hypothetical protein